MTAATKKTTRNTRHHMVETAFRLFHRDGVYQTSVNDILEASDTGKSQFYHYFGSKEGLISDVLDYVTEWVKSNPADTPYQFEINSWESLDLWFEFFVSVVEQNGCKTGCPLLAIGQNLGETMPEIRKKVSTLLKFMQERIERFFVSEQRAGRLQGDPYALAALAMCTVEGGMSLAKVHRDITPFRRSVDQCRAYFKKMRIES